MISYSWPLISCMPRPSFYNNYSKYAPTPHIYAYFHLSLSACPAGMCRRGGAPMVSVSITRHTHTHAHTADVTSSRWRGTHSSVTAGPGTATQILRGECTIGSIRLCLTSRVRPFGQRHVVVYAMQSNSICSRASCQYLGGFISTHGCNLCLAYPVSSIISSSPLFLHDQSDVRSCIDRPVWCIKSLFDRIEDIIGPIISQCHATCFMFYFRQ